MFNLLLSIVLMAMPAIPQNLWRGDNGKISFTSDAPLEVISAESHNLRGIIDPVKNTFAFSVATSSFHGFNSALQQEHFYENYIQSDKYPTATFSGRFIENISELPNGSSEIRAKGMLNIHGVQAERIIKCTLNISKENIEISSKFIVPLADHNITIPQVVHQKIAEEISVLVNLRFER